jgi:lipopolysaccharide/colanic/teichoic acid biosynthesis glycosyltransferase
MKISRLLKYFLRFFFLQSLLTFFTIYYFDRFLMNEYEDGYLVIINNLLEDRDRFYPFVQNSLIKIDIYLAVFIFIFLIILYSTKFFTYVNELTYSLDKKFFDEYFNIYLIWTSSIMTFLFIFRFSVVSRYYLFLLTIIVPFILQIFRNTEIVSSFLGRSVTSENFITFNLSNDSIFKNLRIMTFRKSLGNFEIDVENFSSVIETIDTINKETEVNLIIINLEGKTNISNELENYLISLNKKVLLISKSQLNFNSFFIAQNTQLNEYFLTYFNNDIQYGSKFILKRILDISFTIFLLIVLSPVIILVSFFILIKDGSPIIIKQKRVGLHGKIFDMFKFRTMYKDSHEKRESMQEMNKNDNVIFKVDDDPRVFSGGQILRKYSLDELPQLLNVLKGSMSLVGPRPLFKEDTKLFNKNYMRRLNVLPGLTGLLQINERNTDKFEVWYEYDMQYINNWTLYLDLKILLKTPISIFRGRSKGL